MDVRLPQLAEGADSGTVVNILVKEGDAVQKDQTILELENQKAVAPIPAPAAGTVTQIHVKQGDTVAVGQVLISLSQEDVIRGESHSVRGELVEPRSLTQRPAQGGRKETPAESEYHYASPSGLPPPASPDVRRMAREMGIDLSRVRGTERGGRITSADLRAYLEARQAASPAAPAKPPAPKIDFSKWGPVTRKPFSPLRKTVAAAMVDSWTTIPHVTQFDEADPSLLLKWIEKHAAAYEKRGARLTLTALLIRVLTPRLKEYPVFNSSLDEAAGEIVFKNYIHIGVAVDTEAGLIVPILRDADQKPVLEICRSLADLAEKSRQRKLAAEELRGGTFTISNQGGIGGGHFTPILHKPEVAILGVGRAKQGRLPLSLSYDHRVIDGADAARFITALAQRIETFPESEVEIPS